MSDYDQKIIIGVMGMTGSGKSTFINTLTGDENIVIGSDLDSCTQHIQNATMIIDEQEVYLVDTPGFDDTDRDDIDILEEIAAWLGEQDQDQAPLSGLIYLHRITDPRIGGTAKRNLSMMQSLVGKDNMKNVVLVTNRWEQLASKAEGELRESQLIGRNGFWGEMIQHKATTARYDGDPQTAMEIIRNIMTNTPVYLQMQKELRNGSFKDTSAGQALTAHFRKQLDELHRKLVLVETKLQRSIGTNDILLERQKEYSQAQERMQGKMDKMMEKLAENENRYARSSICVMM